MNILGIGDHVSCGSAVVTEGEIKSAINDERLVREKMVFGVPRRSIAMNLTLNGFQPSDIDAIAVGTVNQHLIDGYLDYRDGWFGLKRGKAKQFLFDTGSKVSKFRSKAPFLESIYYTLRQPAYTKRRKSLERIFREEFGFDCPVFFLDHHLCHVTSAYYTSGFQDSIIFSIDGGGDGKSGRIYEVKDGVFTELASIPSFDSLGCFYSYITQICGFKAGKHEGKITGLAANGEPVYIPQLRKMMISRNGRVENVANVFFYSALQELKRLLPHDFSHKDLAASIQQYVEEMVVDLAEFWIKKTGHTNVGLAGGLFANVKINQRIHEISGVQNIFVHPGMSDEGMPVGAALEVYYRLSGHRYNSSKPAMRHVYLGPEYDEQAIRETLNAHGVEYQRFDNVETEIARLLASDAVVARFHGRMEYGPRALGNRTILYKATDATVNYWMNEALSRTEFMPFAPVVLKEFADQCFFNVDGAGNTARFMTITFHCTDWMADTCKGVVHVDRTARPQLVSESDNPSMYRILKSYLELTGLPVLINTSFNMHEEPIVCSPSDALRAFLSGRLDYLAIGNFIVKHENPIERRMNTEKYESYLNRRGFQF